MASESNGQEVHPEHVRLTGIADTAGGASAASAVKPGSPLDGKRRKLLLGAAAAGAATVLPTLLPAGSGRSGYVQAQTSEPIRIGFQAHRTGIGATYGRWYERTTNAAVALINEQGGINGRQVEIIVEDDGTDPKRGAEVVEKFEQRHACDIAYGTLFSNVVVASAARAGNLKIPYFVASEGHHVASGILNRWTLQPGITDVKSQVIAMAPWVADNLGKKVTMIVPDYAFGYDHRDNFTAAMSAIGGEVLKVIAIPPTETSFTKYLPQIPRGTEVVYHVMVGPAVLTFAKELGDFFGKNRPELFGFIDSLEGVDINSPGLDVLDGSHFWEGMPRYAWGSPHDEFFRERVGVNDEGASIDDPKDVSTYGHMFACWETLFAIKQGMEACDYQGKADRQKLVEAIEATFYYPEGDEHPQGTKVFNGRTHQAFGGQFITKLDGGKLGVVHRTPIEAGLYPDEVDYTTQSF